MLELPTLAMLVLVSVAAGLIDAIAGGGGLLMVPALLHAGVPPQLVLGTNKGAAVFGSAAALTRFWRAGLVDRRRAPLFALCGALGAVAGARALLAVDPRFLRPVILALLVAAAIVVAFVRPPAGAARPKLSDAAPDNGPGVEGRSARSGLSATSSRSARPFASAAIALSIGAYDGFFGPGTGTFLIVALCLVLRHTLSEASANAKVVNCASNLGAIAVFVTQGAVSWSVALPMAGGQLLGGLLGSHLAVRGGDRVVRRAVLIVVVLLVARLGKDLWSAGGQPPSPSPSPSVPQIEGPQRERGCGS